MLFEITVVSKKSRECRVMISISVQCVSGTSLLTEELFVEACFKILVLQENCLFTNKSRRATGKTAFMNI